MARVQIIEAGDWFRDGIHVVGLSPDYPESPDDDDRPDPDFEQRMWMHRHGLAIDAELERLGM